MPRCAAKSSLALACTIMSTKQKDTAKNEMKDETERTNFSKVFPHRDVPKTFFAFLSSRLTFFSFKSPHLLFFQVASPLSCVN
jgi:hypothetical protein